MKARQLIERLLESEQQDMFPSAGALDAVRDLIADGSPAPEDIRDLLAAYGVTGQIAGGYVLALGHVMDEYDVQSGDDWMNNAGSHEIDRMADALGIVPDFDRDFQESPCALYHATTDENADSVKAHGINADSRTRGLSNRSVGSAVFTSTDPDELAYGSYGTRIFDIDCPAMKRDGVLPRASQEPDAENYELHSAVAHRLGATDYAPDVESGMSPNTVILHGSVPAKYLREL